MITNMKNYWDIIMNDRVNALSKAPMQVKLMSMQILAWMWSAVFGIYIVENIYAFGISALAHALLVAAIFLTAYYFKQVQDEQISTSLRGEGGEHE